jgi:predicted N-acetyltransferase YhbS
VVPKYRKKGVAAKLMQHMIESSKQVGRKGIILACKENLINYYEKIGFDNKGMSKSVHGGAKWYDMILDL